MRGNVMNMLARAPRRNQMLLVLKPEEVSDVVEMLRIRARRFALTGVPELG